MVSQAACTAALVDRDKRNIPKADYAHVPAVFRKEFGIVGAEIASVLRFSFDVLKISCEYNPVEARFVRLVRSVWGTVSVPNLALWLCAALALTIDQDSL